MRPRTFVTAFILLFWGTMMFLQVQYEYFSLGREASKDPSYTRQEFSDFLTRDDQIVFLIQDEDRQKIGDMERNLLQTSPDIVTEQKITLNLAALVGTEEEQGKLRVNKHSTYDQAGTLQSFEIRMDTTNDKLQSVVQRFLSEGDFVVSGERRNGKLRMWFGEEDEGNQSSMLGSFFQMSSSFHPMGDLKPPKPGETQTTTVTNPLQKGTVQVEISTSRRSQNIFWQDRKVEAHKVTFQSREDEQNGVRGTAWITKSGDLLRQKLKHPMIPVDLLFLRITPLPGADPSSKSMD